VLLPLAINQSDKVKVSVMIATLGPYLRAQPSEQFARKVFDVAKDIASGGGGKRLSRAEKDVYHIQHMEACHNVLTLAGFKMRLVTKNAAETEAIVKEVAKLQHAYEQKKKPDEQRKRWVASECEELQEKLADLNEK
jgi:hypothetical protein